MAHHSDYRLNPQRAVYISGTINADLLSRVTPQILKLQTSNREAITVYIDSGGGNVRAMEKLLTTLKLSDQDSSEPCRIITAVTNRAGSAAADLLASGDYAIAYPHATILYHGIRTQESDPLTAESSSILASVLRQSSDVYAIELARKIDDRFTDKYLIARNGFDAIRTKHSNPSMADIDCFIELIDENLSSDAKKVWKRAQSRHARYSELFNTVLKRVKGNIAKMSIAQAEGIALKAIVEYEVAANKGDKQWSFRGGGLSRLNEDFFLFNEYLSDIGTGRFRRWSRDWGNLILSSEVMKELDGITDGEERSKKLQEKVSPILEPLASFFAALCHALQEGENNLTATDAYWLGLIDEVVGDDSLLCRRHFIENQPMDDEKGQAKNEGQDEAGSETRTEARPA